MMQWLQNIPNENFGISIRLPKSNSKMERKQIYYLFLSFSLHTPSLSNIISLDCDDKYLLKLFYKRNQFFSHDIIAAKYYETKLLHFLLFFPIQTQWPFTVWLEHKHIYSTFITFPLQTPSISNIIPLDYNNI